MQAFDLYDEIAGKSKKDFWFVSIILSEKSDFTPQVLHLQDFHLRQSNREYIDIYIHKTSLLHFLRLIADKYIYYG